MSPSQIILDVLALAMQRKEISMSEWIEATEYLDRLEESE